MVKIVTSRNVYYVQPDILENAMMYFESLSPRYGYVTTTVHSTMSGTYTNTNYTESDYDVYVHMENHSFVLSGITLENLQQQLHAYKFSNKTNKLVGEDDV